MSEIARDRVIQQVVEDYRASEGPFDGTISEESAALPIERIWREMFTQPEALYLTLSTALNYSGKQAETLRWRTKELWETERWIYEPDELVGNDRYYDLLDLFKGQDEYENHPAMEEYGLMEGGKRDANIWYTISATLYEEYDSNPMQLFEAKGHDARSIFDHVQTARREEPAHEEIRMTKAFPYLGGEKVGPLWLRLIDDLVTPLEGVELLPLPVDAQIVKVTNYLFDTEYPSDPSDSEKEEIRDLWHPFCKEHDISTAELDDAFWRIGEQGNWDDWGKEYLDNLLAEA